MDFLGLMAPQVLEDYQACPVVLVLLAHKERRVRGVPHEQLCASRVEGLEGEWRCYT